MNKIHRFETTVLKTKELTPSVRSIDLSVPEDFKFDAGQYVSIVIDDNGKKIARSYSIASDPKLKHIELCVKKVENGPASCFLHRIKPGDKIRTIGPAGVFTLADKTESDVVFISTGTGITPFRSMIYELLSSNFKNKIYILSGFRYENEVLYKDEFEELKKGNDNLQNYEIVSQPTPNYNGEKGKVQDLIKKYIPENFSGRFFICGLTDMIDDVSEFLISSGTPKQKIHFEKYD